MGAGVVGDVLFEPGAGVGVGAQATIPIPVVRLSNKMIINVSHLLRFLLRL